MSTRPSTAALELLLDQHRFDRVAALHERFLRGLGGTRATLQHAVAPRIDARRRLLNDSDFTGADLQGALFTGSHLERASLYCADLRGCDLRAANLRRADLRGANLAGSALTGAVMDEADMRAGSILHAGPHAKVRAPSRRLRPGHHGRAEAAGADFSNCAMRGVRLCDANLKGADFTGAVLDRADLTGAKLVGAIFYDTVLTSVAVDGLSLNRDQLAGCVFGSTAAAVARAPTLLERLRAAGEWAESGGRQGAPAVLDGEDLRPLGGAVRGRLLTALSARGVCAISVDFSGSELHGAVFDHADLRGAVFDGADLRGASFNQAKLSHARFTGADLRPLVLPSGRVHPASFDGAALERVNLSDARQG
jgi:uncharacterized protein YjbI with pentapeptide repeats